MAFQSSIAGVAQLSQVAKALKGADKSFRKELRVGLNRAAKPLTKAVKDGIGDYVPSGYAPVLKRAFKARPSIKLSGNFPRMSIVGSAKGRRRKRDVKAIDGGLLRHPVYGNREVWVAQKIKSGFWTEPLSDGAPTVRKEVLAVVERINKDIAKKGKG